MNKPKPVIALNLPETGLEPRLLDYFRACEEKLGFVPKLKAFIDMVDDPMLGESG